MKKNRILNLAGIFLLIFVAFEGLHLYVVLNPQFFFKHSFNHGQFRVYSNKPIDLKIARLLDDIRDNLIESELHSHEFIYNVVIAGDGLYSKIDGIDVFASTIGNCIILGGKVDTKRNRLVLPKLEVNFVYVVTHEAVHCEQHKEYGFFMNTPLNFGRYPSWKIEGYAEWISQKKRIALDPTSISNVIKKIEENKGEGESKWIELGESYTMPLAYLKDRVLVEYLIQIKDMSYTDIIKGKFEVDELFEEIKTWSNRSAEQGTARNG